MRPGIPLWNFHPRLGRAKGPHSGQDPTSPPDARQSPNRKTPAAHAPRALRSPSQRRVARSEPGRAMRAMIEPIAAARNDAPMPSSSSRVRRPSWSIAHSPTCSTPTERGRSSSREYNIDVLDVAAVSRGRADGAHALAGEQLGGDVLGVRLKRRGGIASQWHLPAEEFVDAPAQRRPVALGDLEVSSQIEPRCVVAPWRRYVRSARGGR